MAAHSVNDDEQSKLAVGDEPVLVSWPDTARICYTRKFEIH
jgi:hypothetical protein